MLFWDTLSNCNKSNLYETILEVFSQRCFSKSVVDKLHDSLLQKTVKYIHEEALNVGVPKNKPDSQETMIFEAVFMVLMHFKPEVRAKMVLDFESFLTKYPSFKNDPEVGENELMRLLLFHNMMVNALHIIPAKFKKTHLLDLVCRVSEGNLKKYCCGGGQSTSVDRRVLIYETVGGVTKKPRAPRWDEIIATLAKAIIPHTANSPTPDSEEEEGGDYYPGPGAVMEDTKDSSGKFKPPNKLMRINSRIINHDIISTVEHGNLQVTTNEAINKNSNISVRSSTICQQQGFDTYRPGAITTNQTTNYLVNQVLSPTHSTLSQIYATGNPNMQHGTAESKNYVEVMQHVVISDMSGQGLLPPDYMYNNQTRSYANPYHPSSGNNGAMHPPEMMKQSSDREILELLFESGVLDEEEDVIMSYTPSVNPVTGARWPESASNSSSKTSVYRGSSAKMSQSREVSSSSVFSNTNSNNNTLYMHNNNNALMNIVEYTDNSISLSKQLAYLPEAFNGEEIILDALPIPIPVPAVVATSTVNNSLTPPIPDPAVCHTTTLDIPNTLTRLSTSTNLLGNSNIKKLLNIPLDHMPLGEVLSHHPLDPVMVIDTEESVGTESNSGASTVTAAAPAMVAVNAEGSEPQEPGVGGANSTLTYNTLTTQLAQGQYTTSLPPKNTSTKSNSGHHNKAAGGTGSGRNSKQSSMRVMRHSSSGMVSRILTNQSNVNSQTFVDNKYHSNEINDADNAIFISFDSCTYESDSDSDTGELMPNDDIMLDWDSTMK